MLVLGPTYWYVVWAVMAFAFICAWFFIVLGCRKMDKTAEEQS